MLALARMTVHSEYWEEAEYCTIEGGSGYIVVGVCKYSLLSASIGSKDWDLRNAEMYSSHERAEAICLSTCIYLHRHRLYFKQS